MPTIEGDVIRIRDTEANILAGKPKVGQFAYATDTETLYLRLDNTTYQKINPVLEAPVDGKQYVRINSGWAEVTGFVNTAQLNASVQWRNGFDCSEDPLYKYGLQFTWDNTAKKASITHTSGTVKLWTYDTYYEYTNGDPELTFSTALANEDNDFFAYFDNAGQLVWIRTADVTNEALYSCIALKMTYCTTAANEILAIKELHDAFEPIGIRGRLHNTTGTVWSSGASLTGATVGSTTIGIAQGVAYDEDVKITMGAQINGSAILPKYFFDGLNASSLPRIKRGSLSPNIGLYDTEVGIGATGRVVYNNWTGTVWNLQTLAASDYMCIHVFGANGADFVADVDYSIAIGQDNYNTISDARDGAASEALNLTTGSTTGREAVLLYTFIINADGEIQAVDGTGATFLDWRSAKSTAISGVSNDQDIASVLSVGNDAEGQEIVNLLSIDFQNGSTIKRTFQIATSIFTTINAYFDGSNWQRDSTSDPSRLFSIGGGGKTIESRYSPAGTGVITWINNFYVGSDGISGIYSSGSTDSRNVIEQDGTGVASQEFLLTGSNRWVTGASRDGSYKMSPNTGLDTNVVFQMLSSGILLLPDATIAEIVAAADSAVVTKEYVNTESFSLSFKFSREGFDGTFPGGTTQYSLPYTSFAEDGSTQIPGGGARATVDSKITAITFQFDSMAGDATAYYRINKGSWVSLGTVASATLYNTFSPASLLISAGDEFEVAFSSTSTGSFKGCTATAYARNQF